MKVVLIVILVSFITKLYGQDIEGDYRCIKADTIYGAGNRYILANMYSRIIQIRKDSSFYMDNISYQHHNATDFNGKWSIKGDTLILTYLFPVKWDNDNSQWITEQIIEKLLCTTKGELIYIDDDFWKGWIFNK